MNELTTTRAAAPANFYGGANMLEIADKIKDSSFIPAALRGDPGNAFLAVELANRTGLPLMATLQGMYVIQDREGRPVGKPSFYANFIHALIRKSGAFIDTYYEEGTDGTAGGQPNRTCRLVAVKPDGTEVKGPTISMAMAQKAGWISRNNAIWGAYSQTMLQNRAVTFFARQCCPELIFGIDPDGDIRTEPEPEAAPAESLKERLAAYQRPAPAPAEIQAEEAAPKPKRGRPKKAAQAEPEPEPDPAPFPVDGEGEFSGRFYFYQAEIDRAGTPAELAAIGTEIKKHFDGADEEMDALREAYKAREAELAQ